MTVATIAIPTSVQPPAPPAAPLKVVHVVSPPIKLAAQVQPTVTATALPNLLIDWLRRIAVPPSAGQPVPTPQFPPVVAPTSIGSSIKNVYNAVEPWVRWGFDVAAYAVGWIPWVGWLAPQITIFYNLGERIVRSITFNIADWLDRQISFGQGLVNVGVDTINSFIIFANDQLAFWLPPTTQAATAVTAAAVTGDITTTDPAQANEKQVAVNRQAHTEVIDEEAARAADEVTGKGEVESEVVSVKTPTEAKEATEADEPKETNEPTTATEANEPTEAKQTTEAKEPRTTTSTSTDVAAQGEVRGATGGKTTESAKVSSGDKKGDKGPAAKGTTESSTGSAATNDDKGEKKDVTGKKE
jgi:hypothetical protein